MCQKLNNSLPCLNGRGVFLNLSSQDFAANLQRIFSQNKAEDEVKPLWLNEDDNAIMREKTQKGARISCEDMFLLHVRCLFYINIERTTNKAPCGALRVAGILPWHPRLHVSISCVPVEGD
jgi:hypothetical protein